MSIKTTRNNKEDSEILARIALGDHLALKDFYDRFEIPLYTYLLRISGDKSSAEDILQEVMLIVWDKANTFKGNAQVASWVFGIAHNLVHKTLRQQDFHQLKCVGTEKEIENVPDPALTPEGNILQAATNEEINRVLHSLTPDHQEVLQLVFYEGFSLKQVAEITGVPEGTVKSRLSYARQAFKNCLLRNGWVVK